MADKQSHFYLDAALAMGIFMAALFALVGVLQLAGVAGVELIFIETPVTSRAGTLWWIAGSIVVGLVLGIWLRRRMKKP